MDCRKTAVLWQFAAVALEAPVVVVVELLEQLAVDEPCIVVVSSFVMVVAVEDLAAAVPFVGRAENVFECT